MSIPRSTITTQNTPGAPASTDDLIALFCPVASNADHVPRVYAGTDTMETAHGFGEHIEYAGLHISRAKGRILLLPLPIASPGVVSREDTTGNSGTSTTTLSEGADGILAEHDGIVKVLTGGTIGTDQIYLSVSLDNGLSYKTVRLGTANSYAFVQGLTMSFGAGTLVAGDTIHRWHGSAPKSDATAWAAAFTKLKEETYFFRSALLLGDVNATEAGQFLTQVNAYKTEVDRFVYGRVSAYDRFPAATMSKTSSRMVSGTALTFEDDDDTVTRAAGSWLSEGFRVGDHVTFTGTSSNNFTAIIQTLTATVMTLDSGDVLADEVTSAGACVGVPGLVFTASSDTIVRSQGSWVDDGFREDGTATITGTSGNNVSLAVVSVTPLTLTLANGLADEDIGTAAATIVEGQTIAAWAAEVVDHFAGIDAQYAIDISMGRYPEVSPVTQWLRRWPASVFASVREYSFPEHVATWRKDDGPVAVDSSRNPAFTTEYDDRIHQLGNANRFTTLRTWANGPRGVFVCTSRTRGSVGLQLSQTHQVAVFNKGLRIVQNVTENFIGRNVVLDAEGHAESDERSQLEGEVATELSVLMQDVKGEGQQCSSATWKMATDDDLNTPEATVTGYFEIKFNGTIFGVNTIARTS